jgi:hypothetical protein
MVDFYVISDFGIIFASLFAAYLSFRVWRIYLRDIMRTVAALSAVAFGVLVVTALLDASIRLEEPTPDLLPVRFGMLVTVGLFILAWVLLLRWAEAASKEKIVPQ